MTASRTPRQPKPTKTGSPGQGEPVYVAIGRIRKSHGVRGEMRMELLTDFPERLVAGRMIYLGEEHRPATIDSARLVDRGALIHIEGIDSPEEAGLFRNCLVYSQAEQLPSLPEGEYYHHQVLGLQVVDSGGKLLGILKEILETGANDVYVIKSEEGAELLLPVIPDVILSVNLEKRQITVNPPEWE